MHFGEHFHYKISKLHDVSLPFIQNLYINTFDLEENRFLPSESSSSIHGVISRYGLYTMLRLVQAHLTTATDRLI